MTGRRDAHVRSELEPQADEVDELERLRWLDRSTERSGDRRARTRRPTAYARLAKPAFDRVVGALLLVLLSPLFLLVALAVRLGLGSRILYRQERVGLGGQPFSMLKFRTMHGDRRRHTQGRTRPDRRLGRERRTGVDRRRRQVAFDGPERRSRHDRRTWWDRREARDRRLTHKTPDDPRHTRLGRFLRRYSLDELPQLINVVRGDLSLVGPRPELPEVVATYEPWQHERHRVKPGITGLWQVTDRAEDAIMVHHVETDLEYIEGQSLWLDLRILAQTPLAVLGVGGGRSAQSG